MASKQEMMLAVLAVKRGDITPDKVQECMDIQRRFQEEKNQTISLFKIFIAKKYLSVEQIKQLQAPPLPKTVALESAKRLPDYFVKQIIGEGGVATVFHAIHKPTATPCALKILFPIHAVNLVFVDRFKNESELLVRFDHPNIVKGFEYGIFPTDDSVAQEDKLHFLAMELVPGRSVQDDINEYGGIEENKALHIIIQIAEALEYLGENKVVHRDIKPDNILYDQHGNIKLCDLGFAKEVEDHANSVEDVTCGTVQYISPEQARGYLDVDIRADIYSLGATLFHLVTGKVPFSGKDSMDIMAKQVLESLDSERYRGLSPYIGYFIEKMMAKEREIRYQTPREVIEDINEIIKGTQDLQYSANNDPKVEKLLRPIGYAPKRTSNGSQRGRMKISPPLKKAPPLKQKRADSSPKPILKAPPKRKTGTPHISRTKKTGTPPSVNRKKKK